MALHLAFMACEFRHECVAVAVVGIGVVFVVAALKYILFWGLLCFCFSLFCFSHFVRIMPSNPT